MVRLFFIGFIFSFITLASSSDSTGVRDFKVNMDIYSKVEGGNRTRGYLYQLAKEEQINLILVPGDKKKLEFDDFIQRYKKETTIANWVLIFEKNHDIHTIEKLIYENIRIYNRYNYKGFGNLDEKVTINIYNTDTDSNDFNIMMSRMCGFSINNNDGLTRVTINSKHNILTSELCESFPVVLGASGISIHVEGRDLAFKNVNIMREGK